MNRAFLIAGSGVAIVAAVAIVAIMFEQERPPAVPPRAPPPRAAAPAMPGAPATIDAPARPTFDIVRVSPNGGAVIAGRAAPNAEITVGDQSGGR